MYIPLIGLVVGSVRLVTRFLERAIALIRNRAVRTVVESVLTLVLLWTLVPVAAECRRTVERWNDAEQLYATTLRNYPQSRGALVGLTQLVFTRAPAWQANDSAEPPSRWQSWLDALLLRSAPESSAALREQAQTDARAQRYVEASSSLARAVIASTTPQEQVDAGKTLMDTLSRAGLGDQALTVQRWLTQYFPAETSRDAVGHP
jgi:hypothetical protein